MENNFYEEQRYQLLISPVRANGKNSPQEILKDCLQRNISKSLALCLDVLFYAIIRGAGEEAQGPGWTQRKGNQHDDCRL